MYKKSGSTEHECYPITALPRQIEGVLVGVVIKQKADGSYGISVRTDSEIDASQICSRLGGGGHRGAAGCRSKGSIEQIKEQILDSVKISLEGINQ
jgi:phosphoesterase RecJ-like protein